MKNIVLFFLFLTSICTAETISIIGLKRGQFIIISPDTNSEQKVILDSFFKDLHESDDEKYIQIYGELSSNSKNEYFIKKPKELYSVKGELNQLNIYLKKFKVQNLPQNKISVEKYKSKSLEVQKTEKQ